MAVVAQLLTFALLLAQAAAATPSFEVAAIKRSANLDGGGSLGLLPGGRFRAINWDVRALIGVAYRTRPPRTLDKSQIIGVPEPMTAERYDINAKVGPELAVTIDAPNRDPDLMPKLVRSLLADRFKLTMHYEKRDVPVYALVSVKPGTSGPRLQASDVDCQKDRSKCFLRQNPGIFTGRHVTIETLAIMLGRPSGRMVFDRTGLTGSFDIDLEWAEEPGSDKPSIFAAVQEQLGLKLESARESVDVVVIDHIERPVED